MRGADAAVVCTDLCSKICEHAGAACLSIDSDVLCAAQTLSYAGVHMEDGNRLEDYHVPAVRRPLKGFGVGFLEHAAPGSPRACCMLVIVRVASYHSGLHPELTVRTSVVYVSPQPACLPCPALASLT